MESLEGDTLSWLAPCRLAPQRDHLVARHVERCVFVLTRGAGMLVPAAPVRGMFVGHRPGGSAVNRIFRAAALIGIGCLTLGASAQLNPAIVREGTGERRAALNAMELAPWSSDSLSKLSDWVGGKAPSSSDLSGKVVLLCTYSNWYPVASRGMALAERLATSKSADGLVVIAAHDPKGWDSATKNAAKEGVNLFVGYDKDGGFRQALKSDQDPDFYVIDRAGQMRFADIATESVESAVKLLLAETADQAAGIKGELASAKDKADREARRTDAIRSNVDTRNIPEMPFAEPTPDDYAKAAWPTPEKSDKNSSRDNNEGPKSVTLPAPGTCFPKDPLVKGRAIIMYVWSPKVRSSYDRVMPQMELEQKRYGRDVAVIGALVDVREKDSDDQKQDVDPMKLVEQAKKYARQMSLEHVLTLYAGGMLGGRDFSSDSSSSDFRIPWVAVASSDGVIRWEGDPSAAAFRATIEGVLRVDPGIKARRAAEEKYLSEKK